MLNRKGSKFIVCGINRLQKQRSGPLKPLINLSTVKVNWDEPTPTRQRNHLKKRVIFFS